VKIEIFPDAASAAHAAAGFLAGESRASIAAPRPVCGRPERWQHSLVDASCSAREDVQWDAIQFLQVDERVALEMLTET
jgi:6-phosphogluconolactonase/glucosamine-6-phosphate isomerase/deaminase